MIFIKHKHYKRLTIFLILITFMTNVSYAANAANIDQYGFDCFTKRYEYKEDTFCDISKEWIKKSLKPSYELGLISGRTSDRFDPNGYVTIAEALSIASRVHEIYYGGDGIMNKMGSKWYDGAIIYAIDNNIIKPGQFSNYEKKATRAEVADLFSHSLPQTALKAINHITELPDIKTSDSYHDSILYLYNAGILSGSDDFGTFYPNKQITRAEIAVLLTRMVIPSERKKLSLKKNNHPLNPSSHSIKSNDGSFSLSITSDWIENNPNHSSQSNLELSAYDGLCQLAAITTNKDNTVSFDLLSYNASCIEELSKKISKASYTQPQKTVINGNNALLTAIKGNVDNIPMNYYIMAIENETQIVLVSTVFPDSLADELHPKITALYNSLLLIKE
ncbi:MAG: S-layer homology domain-containing protein [Anaerovorax sp.]|nr:S-layer homology domain-containing protein [Anaerovorax sp.]